MSEDIMDYKYLWDGSSSHWRLVNLGSGDEARYVIVDIDANAGLIIEDDKLETQIIEKMLSAGVQVILPNEF